MTGIDWDSPEWGSAATCIHIGSSCPDTHTESEEAAEVRHEF